MKLYVHRHDETVVYHAEKVALDETTITWHLRMVEPRDTQTWDTLDDATFTATYKERETE